VDGALRGRGHSGVDGRAVAIELEPQKPTKITNIAYAPRANTHQLKLTFVRSTEP